MRVCLFERDVSTLDPVVLTRPAFDLRCGIVTLGEKARRACAADEWAAWVRPELRDLTAVLHPGVPVNDPDCGASLWLDARWLPPANFVPPTEPSAGAIDGDLAWICLPPGHSDLDDVLRRAASLPTRPAGGAIVRYLWELVDRNGGEIVRDADQLKATYRPDELTIVGPADRAVVDPTARVDPLVVFDVTAGPVVVGAGAVVTAFSRIEGPCFIGPGTQVMGAKIRGGTTLGPQCRIGGEVEASIVQGYTNKYHDGFLGHSYLGEWINLGAGTQTSDLRNDYGPIEVTVAGRRVASGRTKIGCYMGDHAKTGLSTLINSGSNIGPFCNVLPSGRYAAKHIPPFVDWWNAQLRPGGPLAQLLAVAKRVMERRGGSLTTAHVALYEHLWNATETQRDRLHAAR